MDMALDTQAAQRAEAETVAIEFVAQVMEAAAGGEPAKRKRQQQEERQAPSETNHDEQKAMLDEFKARGGVAIKIGPNFPDRSEKALLRMGAMLTTASETASVDWVGNTPAGHGLKRATLYPFCDNVMLGTLALKRDLKQVVYKRADGSYFESTTSEWKHIKAVNTKLRSIITTKYKIKDHTAMFGATHIAAVRLTPIPEVTFNRMKQMGLITPALVHGLLSTDSVSCEDVLMQEVKFQCHDIDLRTAVKIAQDGDIFNAGFYLIDLDATQDCFGVCREAELIEWAKRLPRSSMCIAEEEHRRCREVGPYAMMVVDNGHTTGRNSFTFYIKTPLHKAITFPADWTDAEPSSEEEWEAGKCGDEYVMLRVKYYLVLPCRIEKSKVCSTSGTNLYPFISSRFTRFAEAKMATKPKAWQRLEVTYKFNLLDPINARQKVCSAAKMEADLNAFRKLIPANLVYKSSHTEMAAAYKETRLNSSITISTWEHSALVAHSVNAATGAISCELPVAKWHTKAHHVLGLMPSHEIVDVTLCVRGAPYVNRRAVKTEKAKLSQVEREASRLAHEEAVRAAARRSYELGKERLRKRERADSASAKGQGTIDMHYDTASDVQPQPRQEQPRQEPTPAPVVSSTQQAAAHDEREAAENEEEEEEDDELDHTELEVDDDGVRLGEDGQPMEEGELEEGEEEEEDETGGEEKAPEKCKRRKRVVKDDTVTDFCKLAESFKVPPGYLGFVTLRILRANKTDAGLAPLTYLGNPRQTKLFSDRERDKGIPDGFNRNGSLIGDEVGSLEEHNTNEGVKQYLLQHAGFAPCEKLNLFLESGKVVDKRFQSRFMHANVSIKLSQHPYQLSEGHIRALCKRNVGSRRKVSRTSGDDDDDKDELRNQERSDVSLDVDRSRGKQVKAAAKALELKILAQIDNVRDTLQDSTEELVAFKAEMANGIAARAFHLKLDSKRFSIVDVGPGSYNVLCIRTHSDSGRHSFYIDSKRNDNGRFTCLASTKHISAGIAASDEKLANMESVVNYEAGDVSDTVYHQNGRAAIAVLYVQRVERTSTTRVIGTLTLTDGTLVWDSSVPIARYAPGAVAEEEEKVEAPPPTGSVNVSKLPSAMAPGSRLGIATSKSEQDVVVVQEIADRWGTPAPQEFLQLCDKDLPSVKRMKAFAPLMKKSVYLKFVSRTALPVFYRQQACIVSQWVKVPSDPNTPLNREDSFLCWTEQTYKPDNFGEMVKSMRTPGVGRFLYQQQKNLAPGSVFHVKAYACGKLDIPWGILYAPDDWANHFDYYSLPTITKGKDITPGEARITVLKAGTALVYPVAKRNDKGTPQPFRYTVLVSQNGTHFRFAQPDTARKKFKFTPGCIFDAAAWAVLSPPASTGAGSSSDPV
jgi:hypothetical protein